jgi:hypothetical protein
MLSIEYEIHDIKAIIRSCDILIKSCDIFSSCDYYLTLLDNTNLEDKELFIFIFNNIKPFFVNIIRSTKNDALIMQIQKLQAVNRYCKYLKYFLNKFSIINSHSDSFFHTIMLRITKKHKLYKTAVQHEFSKQQQIKLLKKTSIIEDIITHHISKYL